MSDEPQVEPQAVPVEVPTKETEFDTDLAWAQVITQAGHAIVNLTLLCKEQGGDRLKLGVPQTLMFNPRADALKRFLEEAFAHADRLRSMKTSGIVLP